MGVAKDGQFTLDTFPFAALVNTANSKADLAPDGPAGITGKPYGLTLSEFGRLRRDLAAAMAKQGILFSQYSISGPWPIEAPFITELGIRTDGTTVGYPATNPEFYFADTGNVETLSAVQIGGVGGADLKWFENQKEWKWYKLTPLDIGSEKQLSSPFKIEIIIGGDRDLRLTGRFSFTWHERPTYADGFAGDPPSTYPTDAGYPALHWHVETDFPGLNFVATPPPAGTPFLVGTGYFVAEFDTLVSPGKYSITISLDEPRFFHNPQMQGVSPSNPPNKKCTAAITTSARVEVPGIHNSKKVFKLQGPRTATLAIEGKQFPFGIFYADPGYVFNSAGTQIVSKKKKWIGAGINYESTTPGFFVGNTRPINNLGMDVSAFMPWNRLPSGLLRVPAREEDTPPERWKAKTQYAIGDQRLDSNGNLQYCVTAAGARTSGLAEPVWNTTPGGLTDDNTPQLQWKLTHDYHMTRARARIFSVPRWPHYKEGGAVPDTNFGISPAGWWIYRIHINRIPPPNSKGINAYDTAAVPPAIPVQIGCIRSGAFVQLGAGSTGQVIDAMWPIFTATALVYRAAEVVDIQASIFNGYVNAGNQFNNIGYPLAAAHYNDIEACLSLLPVPAT